MNCDNISPVLKGKGLFVFSDPGGAKPVLSLVLLSMDLSSYRIISDRTYDFYNDFNVLVEENLVGDEEKILHDFKPDFLYTGTSYTSKIELKYIEAAKRNGIPSFSFIDHYTNFRERFKNGDTYIFPDEICVLDEKAISIANKSDLGSAKITITGNPYQVYIRNWKPEISREFFFNQTGIPVTNKLIVFAPDPLTNVGGKQAYGLDEITVCKDFISVLEKLSTDKNEYTIVMKFHPNQKMEEIMSYITQFKSFNYIIADSKIHTNTLLYYADLVLGIFSNILIEALLLGTHVIRHLRMLRVEDPLSSGIGTLTYTNLELEQELSKLLAK